MLTWNMGRVVLSERRLYCCWLSWNIGAPVEMSIQGLFFYAPGSAGGGDCQLHDDQTCIFRTFRFASTIDLEYGRY